MPACEMCGREAPLVKAEIEDSELNVCHSCARYGKIKSSPANLSRQRSPAVVKKPSIEEAVVSNYAQLIRSQREMRNLNQEDFAKLLNEKESVAAKWEAGSLKPGVETAKKLEKILGIKLVYVEELEDYKAEKGKKSDVLTLGDFVKVRKRK